jgi:bifunctional DNA-binding transcriptional regulator/antitoxin component of YhaV-PrlF toxin-antitoxin module
MNNTFQVRVVRNRTVILPEKPREINNIKRDNTVTLIELDNAVLVIRLESSPIDKTASNLAKE